MLGRRLRNGFGRAFANQSKLIIVGFAMLDRSLRDYPATREPLA